ncbi:MAG: hypothetical protein AAGH74_14155 [Pseudomonadota bacterium]
MMRRSLTGYFIFTAALAGFAGILDPHIDRSGKLSLVGQAEAQLRLQDCRETFIPGTASGETMFRCNDGRYYIRVGGRYLETNEAGQPLIREVPENTPSEPVDQAATLDPADPAFKTAPSADDQQPLDTSRSGFKKVPGS